MPAISASAILRSAAKLGIVPSEAAIDRKGHAVWRAGELSFTASLHADLAGELTWQSFVADAKLGPRMSRYGGLTVALESTDGGSISWPTSERLSPDHQKFLADGIGASQRFVTGRRDLAEILASEDDIVRGSLTTWLLRPSYPARLVQALIIANDAGLAALAETIRERLRGDPIILADGTRLEVMKSAEYWAREYGKALGIKIAL